MQFRENCPEGAVPLKIIEQNIKENIRIQGKSVHNGGLKGRSSYLCEVIYAYNYLFT